MVRIFDRDASACLSKCKHLVMTELGPGLSLSDAVVEYDIMWPHSLATEINFMGEKYYYMYLHLSSLLNSALL